MLQIANIALKYLITISQVQLGVHKISSAELLSFLHFAIVSHSNANKNKSNTRKLRKMLGIIKWTQFFESCKWCDTLGYKFIQYAIYTYQGVVGVFGLLIIANASSQIDSMNNFVMFVTDKGAFYSAIVFLICGRLSIINILYGSDHFLFPHLQ